MSWSKAITSVLLVVMLAGCSTKQLGFASTGLILADWQQTRYIANHPEEYYEKYNLFLPKHPSEKQVNTYFALRLAVHAAGTFLPEKYRRWYYMFTIADHGLAVANNLYIGIGIPFD